VFLREDQHRVIDVSEKFNVCRINAIPNVTEMMHIETVRYWTNEKLVRKAVSVY